MHFSIALMSSSYSTVFCHCIQRTYKHIKSCHMWISIIDQHQRPQHCSFRFISSTRPSFDRLEQSVQQKYTDRPILDYIQSLTPKYAHNTHKTQHFLQNLFSISLIQNDSFFLNFLICPLNRNLDPLTRSNLMCGTPCVCLVKYELGIE